MKRIASFLAVVFCLAACRSDDAPTGLTPDHMGSARSIVSTDASTAIFLAALAHDPAMRGRWKTIVVEAAGRTARSAPVTLYALDGQVRRYDMKLDGRQWTVASAETFRTFDGWSASQLVTPAALSNPVIAEARDVDPLQIVVMPFHLIRQTGDVYDLVTFSSNVADMAQWLNGGPFVDQVGTDSFTVWTSTFKDWRAVKDNGDGTETALTSTAPTWNSISFGTQSGANIGAKYVYLHYSNTSRTEARTVTTVSIAPPSVTMRFGDSVALAATARDQLGSVMTGTSITWTVGDSSIARLTAVNGAHATLVGTGVGTTTVRVTIDGKSASANVTVNTDLTAFIDGPTFILKGGLYTWTVTAGGGNGSYTYAWAINYDDFPGWGGIGTGSSSVSFNVAGGDGDFSLRVTVSAPGRNVVVSQHVTNSAGCFPEIIC